MPGATRESDQQQAVYGFAPVTTEAPPGTEDKFDILVATDVLAEGVNLQQCRNVINYDLPWNPMRLVQRHGRVDRIGSPHSRVFLHCFMPDTELGDLLGEERLHRKISQAARSIGTEGEILPGSEVSDRSYTEARDTIEEIRRGEAGFLDEVRLGLSVEELRQELRAGMEDPVQRRQMERLAWGSGSGMAVRDADPGYVFCVRVGDSPAPWFRYVSMADPKRPVVVADILACLTHAHATDRTERVLSEDTYRGAYKAWEARQARHPGPVDVVHRSETPPA